MSKVVRLSGNTYQRMQKIARPFDDTPDTVIQKLLDYYEREKLGKSIRDNEPQKTDNLFLDADDPSDLTHTKVLEGHFNDVSVRNWRQLVEVAHKFALDELGSFNELRKLTISNIVEGKKDKSGFKPLERTNISIQGANANASWSSALKIAKRLDKSLRMKFRWRYKSGATHPNKIGILKWEPT